MKLLRSFVSFIRCLFVSFVYLVRSTQLSRDIVCLFEFALFVCSSRSNSNLCIRSFVHTLPNLRRNVILQIYCEQNNLSFPMFTFRYNFIFHISAYVSLKIVLSQVKVLKKTKKNIC